MLDLCLLGTGGMMPLPNRRLTSLIIRSNGKSLLIDCGEGTQIGIKENKWSPKSIDIICFTHFHADHISGLPGLLLTIGNSDKTTPLLLVGPKGLKKIVTSLCVIAPNLPFELEFIEIEEEEECLNIGTYIIKAYKVNHNINCYGYSVEIPRKRKFNVEKAKELNIPQKYWKSLQNEEYIDEGEYSYTPDMVLGEKRKGIKVTYCTDSRPTNLIEKYAENADLFICEGMYGEDDKIDKAIEHKHMTFKEAAGIARKASPKEMWLTHFSPSLNKPEDFLDNIKHVFENTKIGKDGMSVEILFEN